MSELTITHGFVKKLATGIRTAYGKDISHTQSIELVAKALGREAGPLMHQLKGTENVAAPVKTFSKTTASMHVVDPLLRAIGKRDKDALSLYLSLVDSQSAMNKLLVGMARRVLGYPAWYAEGPVLEAFAENPKTVLVAAYAICDVMLDDVIDTLVEEFGWPRNEAVIMYSGLKYDYAWAAKIAIGEGYLAFDGGKPVFLSPSAPRRPGMKPFSTDIDEISTAFAPLHWLAEDWKHFESLIDAAKKAAYPSEE